MQCFKYENKHRIDKTYIPGDIIYVKNNRRDKSSPVFTRHFVKEDNNPTILTTNNLKIHKDNIKT